MDAATPRKDRLGPPGYTNGGTHIPLGSEGSSKDSEASSGGGEGQLPETVDINVILPNNSTQQFTVDYGKQMLDFLVQVTATNKLSPTTHTFQLFSEETGRVVEYYASQSVGAVAIPTFHLVQKKSELQRKKERQRQSAAQPFESTHRLTVNLPKNQKMLSRVSPKWTLAEIFKLVCTEKNLDPYKYELRHPTNPDEALNMARPLGDYGLVEISVVSVGPEARCTSDFSLDTADFTSPQNISSPTSVTSSSPSNSLTMEKKKKKGIFSIFSRRKEGKFKPNEATYSDSTSTLPSSGRSPQSPPSFASTSQQSSVKRSTLEDQRPSTSRPSTETVPRTTNSTGGGGAVVVAVDNNNVHKGGAPSKPPRKKRQAPLPPSQQPPVSSASTTATMSCLPPQDPLAQQQIMHSRTSSHSSGFESAGSPSHVESPRDQQQCDSVTAVTGGNSLRAARHAGGGARPKQKQQQGTKKKRAAPVPPGVGRLRLGSDGSAPSDLDSTPATTPRHEPSPGSMDHTTDHTTSSSSGEARRDDEGSPPPPYSISSIDPEHHPSNHHPSNHHPLPSSSLPESPHILRPKPVFTAPPPPDTPPPPSSDSHHHNHPATTNSHPPVTSETGSDVTESSTQVSVNVRDSLSSELGGSRPNSSSSCRISSTDSLSLDLGDAFIDPGLNKTGVAVFTEKMSSLTEDIEGHYVEGTANVDTEGDEEKEAATSKAGVHIAPEGAGMETSQEPNESFTKDSLHDDSLSSDSVSINNYDFGHRDQGVEPALPDLDTSVVLVKKTRLTEEQDDSFYSDHTHTTTKLTESQDSGMGSTMRSSNNNYLQEKDEEQSLAPINNNNNIEKLMPSEEMMSSPSPTIDIMADHGSFEKPRSGFFSASDDNVDRFSVDSLDMMNSVTPTSDSGFSGSLERNAVTSEQDQFDQRLPVTEEITIDQSEVMYIAPGGPKPDLGEQKGVDKAEEKASKVSEVGTAKTPERRDGSLKEEGVTKVEDSPVVGGVEDSPVVGGVEKGVVTETNNNQIIADTGPAEKTDHQPTVFIIEKTKLNQDIRKLGLPEASTKEKKSSRTVTSISSTLADKSLDPDYRKFLSYVDSAKQKTGEVGAADLMPNKSPDAKTSNTSFFVDFEEERSKPQPKSALQSQSLDSFSSSYSSRPYSRADAFVYGYPDGNKKPSSSSEFKITTLEYKPETANKAERSSGSRMNSLRDVYHHRPVGKTASLESSGVEDSPSRPKSMYSTGVVSSAPSYSFYKTEVKTTEAPSPRREEGKRSSTVIMVKKDADRSGQSQPPRKSGLFMGPRPYGSSRKQSSEPSVRDVRKALSIYEAKVVETESISSKGSNNSNSRGATVTTPTKGMDGDVRERCSKLGFSPSGEQESDSVLEEKSISQIALPAQRRVVTKPCSNQQHTEQQQLARSFGSALELGTTLKSDSMDNLSGQGVRGPAKLTKSTENVYDAAAAREKSKKSLQSQYDDLQQQFSKWQTQLQDNQSLLNRTAPTKIDGDIPQTEPESFSGQTTTGHHQQDRGVTATRRVHHRGTTSEFNRRSTIDVMEDTKPRLIVEEETERRGRMFERSADRAGQKAAVSTGGTSSSNNRLEELRYRSRHQGARYNSLTEGVPPPAARHHHPVATNANTSQFSPEELAHAKLKLRLNDEREKGASIVFNADGSSSAIGRSSDRREFGTKSSSRAGYSRFDRSSGGISSRVDPGTRDSNTTSTESRAEKYLGTRKPRQRKGVEDKNARFEPKLDPREELMIAIRSAGGRTVLRKVKKSYSVWKFLVLYGKGGPLNDRELHAMRKGVLPASLWRLPTSLVMVFSTQFHWVTVDEAKWT